jgi:hypothetical protein
MLALVPAFGAGVILTALSLYVLLGVSKHQGEGAVQLTGASLLLVQLCYAPLLLAGPIVLTVANDYRRRTALSAFDPSRSLAGRAAFKD